MEDSFKEKIKKVFTHYWQLLALTVAAAAAGMITGAVDAIFGIGLNYITEFRLQHTLLLIPLLPLAGLLTLWIYKRLGKDSIKGMGLVFETHDGSRNKIPLRPLPLAIGSTWLTHLTGGSVGREGVAVQMGSAISYNIGKLIPLPNSGKILLTVGVAAGFAGLFRTPVAAVFFALEVFGIGLLYVDCLIPAAAAAFASSWLSGLLGMQKFSASIPTVAFTPSVIGKIIVIGIACGITGCLFSSSIKAFKRLFAKWMSNQYVRIAVVGSVAAILLILCGNGRYSGASEEIIRAAVTPGGSIYAWDFIAKLLLTSICVAAGFQGGEVAPMFAIGASLGAVLGSLTGIPVIFAAMLGYAAVFGAGTNTLIASTIVGAEIFGWQFFPYIFIANITAYACNYDHSIYPQHSLKELLNCKF